MADTDLEGARGGAEPLQRSNDVQTVQSTNDDHGNIDVHNQNGSTNIQNTDISIKLGDGRNLIFNTLLTFCVSAMSNALKMNVVQLIVMKFSDNEVVDAKNIMCKNSDNILQYQARKDSQYRSEKFVHAEDIYDGIKKLSDANKLPLYVTDGFGLSRLPKIDAEDITNVSIAEKMSSFERKFATFDESMTAILLRSLDNSDRISAIERHKSHSHSRSPGESMRSMPMREPQETCSISSASMSLDKYPTSGSGMMTPGAVLPTSGAIRKTVVPTCVEGETIPTTVDATTSLCDAPQIPQLTTHHHASGSQSTDGQTPPLSVAVSTMPLGVSQSIDGKTPFCIAVSTMPPMPPNVCTTSAYSTALMSTPPPPSHGMHLDDKGHFPVLSPQQRQITALAQQLRMPIAVPSGTTNQMTSNGAQKPSNDGFSLVNMNKMAHKMSSMRITGKATGGRVRAAPPLSYDVFARKFHKDTTEEDLLDYLNANDIIPKSVHIISHEQARTKSFKICCDRENFIKCFNENVWPDSIEMRKYNPPARSGRLYDNTTH